MFVAYIMIEVRYKPGVQFDGSAFFIFPLVKGSYICRTGRPIRLYLDCVLPI